MLVYHDFRGDTASQIGTHAREKSKQPRCARSQVHPAAALECGLGLRRVQESVNLSTSASTKLWYVYTDAFCRQTRTRGSIAPGESAGTPPSPPEDYESEVW